MTKAALVGALVLVLCPAAVGGQIAARRTEAPAACQASATSLCLSGGRFLVGAAFSTPQGQSGQGQAVSLTSDTGYFWFFSANNVEMVVKVVDGRAVNNMFWVFAAGLTNVNVVLTVTDAQTGLVKTYTNPRGVAFQPIQDTSAFSNAPEGSLKAPVVASAAAEAASGIAAELSRSPRSADPSARSGAEATSTTCTPDPTTLCLNGGRFQVQAQWATPQGQSGAGQAVTLTEDTGYFWFFSPNNVEMVLKVVNGCSLNSRFWVFAGGLTNVQVDLNVVDTVAHTSRVYLNPIGAAFQPIQDTAALQTCSCNVSTFTSSDVPKAIPDPGTVESALVVPPGDAVAAVAVRLTITHPFDSDLKIQLVSPSGNVVTLAEAVGTWGHDFTSTVFDDVASGSILSQLPPFTGTFRPAEPLAAFAASPRAGTWTLRVTDLRARYAGQLVSWGLGIASCNPTPAPAPKAVGASDPPPLPTGVPTGHIPVEGTLITVTTNSDVEDGDTSSAAHLLTNPGPDGKISLREAIDATNHDPGSYTIRFAPELKGTSIDIATPQPGYLPPLQGGGVLIDGDIDGDGRPDVTITNHLTDASATGFVVLSSSNRLHALALDGFPFGIRFTASFGGPLPSHQTFARNIVSGVAVTTKDLSGNGFMGGISLNPICCGQCNPSCDTHNTWADIRLVGNRIVSRNLAIQAALRPTIGDVLERFTVAGNDIQIGAPGSSSGSGIDISAGYEQGSAENRISDALIAYNTIEVGGTAYAISPTAGHDGTLNVVEDLGIIGNRVHFTGVVTGPDSAKGVSFAITDGCAPWSVGPKACSTQGDVFRRARVVGNVFAGQDDAGVLVEDPCCAGWPASNLTDFVISNNLIQGIVPPTKLNPRGIVIAGHTNISNVIIDSNTIEQKTIDPQTQHAADLAGAGVLVVGGLGSGTGNSPGQVRSAIQNVIVTNNRIDTDLTGIAVVGGGPSDEDPHENGDLGDSWSHTVSGVQLSGNVIGRAPVLATRWDPNARGITVIGGFTAPSPGTGNWSKATDCSVTQVALDNNLVAGVVDDVWVRSNFGQGATGNVAALGLRPPTVSVTKTGNGSGTVTSDLPGINCGAACSAPFDERSTVTLSAVAAAGSTFAGWSGDCSGGGPCTLTMSGDRSVTATFTIR